MNTMNRVLVVVCPGVLTSVVGNAMHRFLASVFFLSTAREWVRLLIPVGIESSVVCGWLLK